MPPRRPSPKPRPIEQPSTIHRIAGAVADWKVIVTAVVLLCSGVAYALSIKFATKSELRSVQTDIQVHNEELSGIHQAISDFAGNQKQMMDWVRDIYQHPRK